MQDQSYYSVYLILMRHAVSTWQASSDFDRTLAAGTSSSIHAVTQQLYDFFSSEKQKLELKDLNVLCISPAVRTQSTYQEVQNYLSTLGVQWDAHIDCEDDLYLASAQTLSQRLYSLDEYLRTPSHLANNQSHANHNSSIPIAAMMIAHNPGLSECIQQLSGHMINLREAEAVVLHAELPDLTHAELPHWKLLAYFKP